jgi:two-component system, chemotaxis family, sensor kinase Cph1
VHHVLTETLDRQLACLSAGAHLCPIYSTLTERINAPVPFLLAGLERGQQCLYIADAHSVDDVLRPLRAQGVDIDAAIERGALVALIERTPYVSDGHFDTTSIK